MLHAVNERRQVAAAGMLAVTHRAAVKENLSPFLPGQLVVREDLVNSGLVNNRAGEIVLVERVADAQPLGRGNQLFRKTIEDFLSDEDAAGGYATLPAGLESADNGASRSQIEPGVFADDDRALAAHFAGHDSVVMLSRQFLNAAANFVTAREQ